MSKDIKVFIFDKGTCYTGSINDVKNMLSNKTGLFIERRGHIFVKNDLTKSNEVEAIGDFNNLMNYIVKHNGSKKFAICGISRATAGTILINLEKINEKSKTKDDRDELDKLFNTNDLFVANISPKVEEEDMKHIFEKIEIDGDTYYKDIFTGIIAAKNIKSNITHTITNIENLSKVIPTLKNKEIPELVLVWAHNLINYPNGHDKNPRKTFKL